MADFLICLEQFLTICSFLLFFLHDFFCSLAYPPRHGSRPLALLGKHCWFSLFGPSSRSSVRSDFPFLLLFDVAFFNFFERSSEGPVPNQGPFSGPSSFCTLQEFVDMEIFESNIFQNKFVFEIFLSFYERFQLFFAVFP